MEEKIQIRHHKDPEHAIGVAATCNETDGAACIVVVVTVACVTVSCEL